MPQAAWAADVGAPKVGPGIEDGERRGNPKDSAAVARAIGGGEERSRTSRSPQATC